MTLEELILSSEMVYTKNFKLPTEEELTTPELNVTASALYTGAFHLGIYCEEQSKEFMLCRGERKDPRKCLKEGRDVTNCGIEFFKKVKKSCLEEFKLYQRCMIGASDNFAYHGCRKTEGIFNACVKNHIGVERPRPYYFCEPKVHDSKRPKPEPKVYEQYPDRTPGITEEIIKSTTPTVILQNDLE